MPVDKQERVVDTDNIQGSIWPRLPKYYESYLFFKITKKERFRKHLRDILDNGEITTGTQCENHLNSIGEFEEACARSRRDIPEADRKPFTAVNIAFTHMGLLKVENPKVEVKFAATLQKDPDAYCTDRINEGLFEKGMFDDLVYEGADSPPALHPDFRAPPGNETKTGLERWEWRVDGVFIVAAHTAKAVRKKVRDLEDAFNVGDANEASMKIAFRRDGQHRPGANRGKEHFGYEDHISQPKIKGLDDPPAKGEPHACLPGYIFLGHKGDPNMKRGPEWAKEGSFLVFRQLDQKVPEFEKFLEEAAPKVPGTNYQGPNGPAKLGAHMMGRWKSGAPVAKATDEDNADLAFDNKFDFRPKKSIKGCPFAAHIRKMRPRADKKRDVGTEEDGDNTELPEPESDESEAEGQEEDASVILRRGITFGPELTEEEKRERRTIEQRGIYFTCYQSLIRDGFNFLMTRWASNSSFPEYKTKTFPDGPGMDPFVNQRLRSDHPEGHISLYDGSNPDKTVKLNLGISPWVDQKGGEYFFTPSMKALREHFSTATLDKEGESPKEDQTKELRAKIARLEETNKFLEKINQEHAGYIESLKAQLKESQESHQKYVEETSKQCPTVFGYAGFVHLDFLNRLSDTDLRQLKHQVRDVLGELAGDVDWTQWQRIIRDLDSKYGFGLVYGNGDHYEGRHWSEWKEIQYSASHSQYDRTVAFRNRMGQWCNNYKWNAVGGDAAGCALIWITFVIQLHDVLQVYKPQVC
ncbi:uncharacterized protein CDV56_105583 [Aspergillus thermomutatus]|uniref:DyP dimeric alpha+beta barrel domain-containing protein n=1 Tax=Aspergillus thermomutatus TaxID=41047 RepID=A0A397GG09_ASPTH|nr:uncharacterized protein CDV56_105583 [Aspergillus thermomutatus]RHZ49397.1 hypothetical protein CDV56_105583 [Aspergillus thermomutatus]